MIDAETASLGRCHLGRSQHLPRLCSRVALSLVPVLLVAAITVRAADETPTAFGGRVVNEAGAPLAEATVQVFEMVSDQPTDIRAHALGKATTASDGRFTVVSDSRRRASKRLVMIVARKQGLALGWATEESPSNMNVTISLGKPTEMAGVVLDSRGEPLAGAVVRGIFTVGGAKDMGRIIGLDPVDAAIARTDTRGRFSFKQLPAEAKAELLVSAAGQATHFTRRPDSDPLGRYSAGETDIQIFLLPEAKVTGTVINKETNEPVAGVRIVAVAAENPAPYDYPAATSDAQGKFTLGRLRAIGHRLFATVDPDKYPGLVARVGIIDPQAGETTETVVRLFAGGIVEVAVTDAQDRTPVKTANVMLQRQNSTQMSSGMTNDRGIARISLAPGEYTVAWIYAQPRYSTAQPKAVVTVAAGRTERVDVALDAVPRVTGVLRDPDGKPVEGAMVLILPARQAGAVSGADGAFEIIWDRAPVGGGGDLGYVLIARDTDRDLAAAVEIDPNVTYQGEVKLEPGLTVAGNVTAPDGQPIAGVEMQIELRSAGWSTAIVGSAPTTTDAEGAYQIKALPRGQPFAISASDPDFGPGEANIAPDAGADRRITAPPIVLRPANMTLAGTVVDDEDNPVAEAYIDVHGQGQPTRQVRSDEAGKFTVTKLCAGAVEISVTVQRPKHLYANTEAKVGGDEDVKIVVLEQVGQMQRVGRTATVRSLVGKPLPDPAQLGVDPADLDLDGKPVLVAFFDVRQRPSRHYLKQLAGRYDALRAQGLALIAVQATPLEAEKFDPLVAKLALPFTLNVIAGEAEKTRAAWGVKGLPAFILTDPEHLVRADDFGFNELEAKLAEVIGWE